MHWFCSSRQQATAKDTIRSSPAHACWKELRIKRRCSQAPDDRKFATVLWLFSWPASFHYDLASTRHLLLLFFSIFVFLIPRTSESAASWSSFRLPPLPPPFLFQSISWCHKKTAEFWKDCYEYIVVPWMQKRGPSVTYTLLPLPLETVHPTARSGSRKDLASNCDCITLVQLSGCGSSSSFLHPLLLSMTSLALLGFFVRTLLFLCVS